jgi:hypothetical protein
MKTLKTITIALVLLMAVAATPAFGQLAGVWQGTGQGNAYPRNSTVIYPWQNWKGEIPNSQDVFSGTWYDALGNHGTFKGKIKFSPIPELAVAKGSWYWFDPLGPANVPVYGGDFNMDFWFTMGTCNGTWTTIWPSTGPVGSMTGEYVSPTD